MRREGLLFVLCLRMLLACGPGPETADAASEAGGDDAEDDAGGQDAGLGDGCSKQLPSAYQTIASGTVSGADVSASFCGAVAWLYVSPYSTPKNDVLLFLDSVDGTVHVENPSNAVFGMLSGMMQVGATTPGVYTSAGSCGFLSFTVWLPPPPNVDCGDA